MVQMHFLAYISQRTPRRSHSLTFRAESDWLQVSSTIACSVQLTSKTSAYQLVVFDSIFRLLFIWLLWSLKQLWMRHRRHCWADNSNHARQQRAPQWWFSILSSLFNWDILHLCIWELCFVSPMSDEMGWDVPVMCRHIGATFQIVVLLKLMKLSTQKSAIRFWSTMQCYL